MDIAGIDIATKNALAAQYAGQGVLVIQDVALPAGFEPSATDVVFLAVDGACEIYIDARITYTGPAPFWHDLLRGGESPGHTRFVAKSVDFFSTLRTFAQLLATAQPASATTPDQEVRQVWLQKLDLSGNPTVQQIKKAYRRLAMMYHPDRMVGASASELKAAGDRMREIVEAHNTLMHKKQRSCG